MYSALDRSCHSPPTMTTTIPIIITITPSLLRQEVLRVTLTIFIHAMSLDTMLIPVESSAIRAIGYAGGTLVVEFHSGRVYDHPGVPYPVFLELLNARSIGAYYNQHIQGRYR